MLERCDTLLNTWRDKLSDRKLVQNLQREIHTFKGGARMAGLEGLGELTHAMETLLEHIAASRIEATVAAVQALEEGCDNLNRFVEQLQSGRMPEVAGAQKRFEKKVKALRLPQSSDSLGGEGLPEQPERDRHRGRRGGRNQGSRRDFRQCANPQRRGARLRAKQAQDPTGKPGRRRGQAARQRDRKPRPRRNRRNPGRLLSKPSPPASSGKSRTGRHRPRTTQRQALKSGSRPNSWTSWSTMPAKSVFTARDSSSRWAPCAST